jgi:hypothetical protein
VDNKEPFLSSFPRLFTVKQEFVHPVGRKRGLKADHLFTLKNRIPNTSNFKHTSLLVDYAIINAYNPTNSPHNDQGIGQAAENYAIVKKYKMYEDRWKYPRDSLCAMVMDCHGFSAAGTDMTLKRIAKCVSDFYMVDDAVSKSKYAEVLCKLRCAIGAACQVKLAIACHQVRPSVRAEMFGGTPKKGVTAINYKDDDEVSDGEEEGEAAGEERGDDEDVGMSEASQGRIELGLEEMARAAQRDNEVRRRRSDSRDSSDDPVEHRSEAEQIRAANILRNEAFAAALGFGPGANEQYCGVCLNKAKELSEPTSSLTHYCSFCPAQGSRAKKRLRPVDLISFEERGARLRRRQEDEYD